MSTELWPNVICWDETTSFTDECTKRPGNVVVSTNMSAHPSSEMGNYDVEQL